MLRHTVYSSHSSTARKIFRFVLVRNIISIGFLEAKTNERERERVNEFLSRVLGRERHCFFPCTKRLAKIANMLSLIVRRESRIMVTVRWREETFLLYSAQRNNIGAQGAQFCVFASSSSEHTLWSALSKEVVS